MLTKCRTLFFVRPKKVRHLLFLPVRKQKSPYFILSLLKRNKIEGNKLKINISIWNYLILFRPIHL